MDPLSPRFEIKPPASSNAARVGRLWTPHGVLDTPTFLPVGTYASVRGLAPDELRAVGVQALLANTYHLHLRPGEAIVERLGGLHRFMGWRGPILTDSGGFQLHSLDHLCRRSEAGVHFKSPVDGVECFLSPERCIAVQEALGADLIVTLDEFEPVAAQPELEDVSRVRELMERTLRWAERCRTAHGRRDQLLFGIVQGGGFAELRAESAERTRALGFEGFAIGGLGLGESPSQRIALLEAALRPLPADRPRYLMGLGLPPDLVEAVARGVDLFDCVIPTRHGRHGTVFTRQGPLHLRQARFRDDPGPVDTTCGCSACRGHSRAYLRHLLVSNEILGARLASLHNLAFYMQLMREMREALSEGSFTAWRARFAETYRAPDPLGERSGGSSAATHSPA